MSYPKRYRKTCEYCGKEYRTGAPKQKYCGIECQHKVYHIVRKTYHICKQCGKRFPHRATSENKNIFCSRECAFQWKRDNPKNGFPSCIVHFYQCKICGEWFTAHQSRIKMVCAKYECQLEHGRKRSRVWSIQHHDAKEKRFRCKECGTWIEPQYGNKQRSFCSGYCGRRYHNRRHRAIRHGVIWCDDISLMGVYERDGGICQLCHRKVKLGLPMKGGRDATIDHIVPISWDGNHEWSNVQLAHRSCNSKKGNARAGQRMLPLPA